MSLNKVMLIGNVGKDPEVRYLEGNGQPGTTAKVATFTLATTERFRDRNQQLRENTEWHNIVAWRAQADVAEKFIRKGTQIYVEGKLRTRNWVDQNGQKHFVTEIVVDSLQLLGKKSDNPANSPDGNTGPYTGFAQTQTPQTAPPVTNPPKPAEPTPEPGPTEPEPSASTIEDDLPF